MTNAGSSRPGWPPARRRVERAPRRLVAAVQVGAWLALHGAIAHAAHASAAPVDHALRPLRHVVPYAPKFLYLFGLPVRWPGAIHWRYNAANAPPALADAAATVARLQSTFDQWTSACGVRYVYDGPTSTLPDHRVIDPKKGEQPDFENVVGWGAPGVSVAGQTLAWYDDSDQGNFLVDTDMILSSTLVYDAGALARTAAHEFGHMLGLAHSNVNDEIMSGPPYSAYSGIASVQADDVRGCRCLYGLPAGLQAPYVCSLPDRLDFGSVTAGTTSSPRALTMTNSGNAALSIGPISSADGQFVRSGGCDPGTTLAPGASCTLEVSVRPNSVGGRAAELVIGTSDGAYRVPMIADGVAPPPPPPVPTITVVEYYNATLDHYFGTWSADEQASLDAGNTPTRWTRTGQTYRAYATAQLGTSAVCRYYIPPPLGDSHFFGRDAAECAATGARHRSFVLEDAAFEQVFLPSAGACPTGTTPVYRVFSNRADANHRYTTDRATRDRMVTLGWTAEGDGPDAVAMCAP